MSSHSLRRAAALRQTLRRNARAVRSAAAPAPSASPPLGCAIVRRLTDHHGEAWTVREAYAGGPSGGATLVFDGLTNRGGIEIRRAPRTLAQLDDGDLLQLLRFDY